MHSSVNILCFPSRGQHLCKFIGTKESLYIRKEFNSHSTGLNTNIAAVSLFLAAMMSCENTQQKGQIIVTMMLTRKFSLGMIRK